MPNHTNVIFKRSLLAVAIVSLSACSTTPIVDDYDLSPIGAGILKAGRTAADLSEHALARTSYLLGFSDDDALGDKKHPMDEVDIALSLEDAPRPGTSELELSAIDLPQAIANQQPLNLEIPDDTVVASADSATALTDDQLFDTNSRAVAVEDLVHEVASNENLWDISKKTTGDANNWHVLADVNNLSPNASVFPGQQLIIPADMVKPGYLSAPDATIEQAQNAVESTTPVETQSIASATSELVEDAIASVEDTVPSERLLIPEPGANKQDVVAAASTVNDASIKLSPGETLWDFAKRTTGDATNWQAIATHNNFTEKQAVVVRAGQSITVPGALVKPDLDLAAVSAESAAPQVASAEPVIAAAETQDASAISVADETAVVASSELLAEASTLDETQLSGDATAPMTIVEATYKTDASLAPSTVERTFDDSGNLTLQEVVHGEIMVSGTYYPKAIYNDADFSSSLLMRVSPGTTLQVSKAMGNWFEVETNKGVGYVHQRDIK